MRFERFWRPITEFVEHAFVPREVFFRSDDRFHHLRVSVRVQKIAAISAVLLLGWGLFSSGSFVAHKVMLAAKDREIEAKRLAYFDLLGEVGEYHTQLSQITRNLEDNQAYLLSLIEQSPEGPQDLAAIQDRLKSSETEHARVVIARDGLRMKMEQFESELLKVAGKNISLQSQLAQMQNLLDSSRAERDEVAAAREQLVAKLAEVENDLDTLGTTKHELEESVRTLRQDLTASRAVGQDLSNEKAQLTGRVAELEQDLSRARAHQTVLQERIAGLDQQLSETSGENSGLKDERATLQARVGGLEQRLVDLRDAGVGIIERLNERARLSVDTMEKTISMTGLDVETMVASIDQGQLGQGGPFVPADNEVAAFAPSAELGGTMGLLGERLDRWAALQELVAVMPLTAPLDQYRITSSFGQRRDPVNGRKARHRGVDFAAPPRTSIYATAPGKVVYAGWRGRYGRTIEIDHGHGIRTRYSHLRKILVKAGQEVEHREKIGLVGNSGRSTGPHVHYEVRYQGKARNPMKFLKAGKYVFKG